MDTSPLHMSDLRTIPVPSAGPEDVLFSDDSIITGLRNGQIIRVSLSSGTVEVLAYTGGIPLGLDHLRNGSLLVCDAVRGLLSVEVSGGVTVIAGTIDGERLPFCSSAHVGPDGSIYFTSASRRNGFGRYRRDVVEDLPSGRLLCRTPDGSVHALVDGLAFANGVALAPDGASVLVAETGRGRILRYWLSGTHVGTTESFAAELPGLPGNLSIGSDGLLWVALGTPYGRPLRRAHALPLWGRRIVARLPIPKPPPMLRVMAFSFDGDIVHDLEGDARLFRMVSGVRESNGVVVMGSLVEHAIATFRLDA